MLKHVSIPTLFFSGSVLMFVFMNSIILILFVDNSLAKGWSIDIAQKLDIAQATANKTIKRLVSQGYLKKEPYRSIFLTIKGQVIANNSKKRHRIVYDFLINLGLDKITASADSEGIEHHVSEKTLTKMEKFNRLKKNKN